MKAKYTSKLSVLAYTGLCIAIMAITFSSSSLAAPEKQMVKSAAKLSDVTTTADVEKKEPVVVPDLVEVIPLAAKLSGRLDALKIRNASGPDLSALEKKYSQIEEELNILTSQVARLIHSKRYRFNDLGDLKTTIERKNELFEEISMPLNKEIRRYSILKQEWLTEKEHWNEWQILLLKDGSHSQLTSTFAKAQTTIETALALVIPQLGVMLTVQNKASSIQERIYTLSAEIDGHISAWRRGVLAFKSHPIFSSHFISQFDSTLWHSTVDNMYEMFWLKIRLITRVGWIAFFQVIVTLFMIISVYRYRQLFTDIKPWQFLSTCPIAAGVVTGLFTTGLLYELFDIPIPLRLINTIVFGFCLARVLCSMVEASWKKLFVWWLIIVYIITRVTLLINLPSPLFRLCIILIAITSLVLFWRLAGECSRYRDRDSYTRLFRLLFLFFIIIVIGELWGKEGGPEYLFISVIHSTIILLSFVLLMRVVRGGLEWFFNYSPLKGVTSKWQGVDVLIGEIAFGLNVVLWTLFLAYMIMTWGSYGDLAAAIKGLMAYKINLKFMKFTVGMVFLFAGIMYGVFLISWFLQKLYIDKLFVRRHVESGVQHAIRRLIHYVFIVIGFLLACTMFGLELTQLTIILSALGVGIGFGLQGVVNNFVSGLILLFERPVRVGDTIEVEGQRAVITNIGLRATTVQTFEQSDVIIPNADLINMKVTNWTLSSRQVRGTIAVGVAYGSDISLVMETLLASASEINLVAATPEPQALFLRFGESSLEFELWVWIIDFNFRLKVLSAIHQEIDKRFREENIEIAFPQRDLHLRSIDPSVSLPRPETTTIQDTM